MKKYLSICAIAILAACTSGTTNENATDSTSTDSSGIMNNPDTSTNMTDTSTHVMDSTVVDTPKQG